MRSAAAGRATNRLRPFRPGGRSLSPKLSPTKRAVLVTLHAAGDHTIATLAELFSVSRATMYRKLARPKRQPNPDCPDLTTVR
jgi:DNA invertase Pin-like site-specific DNA recombinase